MNYIGATTDGMGVYIGDDVVVCQRQDGTSMYITPEELHIVDKYGNELSMTEIKTCLKVNSPTYDELYQHWLKTKQND